MRSRRGSSRRRSACPAVFVVAAAQSFGAVPLWGIILVLALLRFGPVARLTRQECVRVRTQGFVLSARGLGLHPLRVFLRHVLPNALVPATVAAAFGVAGAILAEAGLSFLGLGRPRTVGRRSAACSTTAGASLRSRRTSCSFRAS